VKVRRDGAGGGPGGVTDRCSRWSTTDSVPLSLSGDVQDNSSSSGRRALSTAAVYHSH